MVGGETAVAALLVVVVAMTQAQVPALGPCPDIETMRNFNLQKVSKKSGICLRASRALVYFVHT